MKVFLDTNVLFSAIYSRKGICAELFRAVIGGENHELVVGEVVLKELKSNISAKFKNLPKDTEEFLFYLHEQNIFPMPAKPTSYPIREPDDAWVLASALESKVDVLITGDKDLLELAGEVTELKIMSPREFYDQLNPPESA